MLVSDTLLIRHLPPDLSADEKTDLLQYFGAVEVKCLGSRIKKSNIAFAKFESEQAAAEALKRLHQLDVLGYPLTVEFAKGNHTSALSHGAKEIYQNRSDGKNSSQKNYEAFLHKLNSWNGSVNCTQPPPPYLKYQYPPPSEIVLRNISYALATVPKFYTQVLHLMNKMNLPCPFEVILFSQIEVPEVLHEWIFGKECIDKEQQTDEVEVETEYESEDEGLVGPIDIIPEKRAFPRKRKIKRPAFVKVQNTKTVSSKPAVRPEEVFEKADVEPIPHRIELKLTTDISALEKSREMECEVGGFGLMFPAQTIDEDNQKERRLNEEERQICEKTISERELAENRIPEKDQKHLPVFKNYQPGTPSCRLYIKNLAKQVEEEDLHFIYRRYVIPNYEVQGTMYDIRLMKEGRMKGQAFVTLQNVKQAERALKETNGFILKDKPMVVQFARSAKAT